MTVAFPKAFSGTPSVMATFISTAPDILYGPTVNDVTATGFKLHIYRTSSTVTSVGWLAVL